MRWKASNTFSKLIEFLKAHGFHRLASIIPKNPVSILKFILRSAVGDLPDYYWRSALKRRFNQCINEIEGLIFRARDEIEFRDYLADILAQYIADSIRCSTKTLPFDLPKKGTILDVGSGYLTGPSGLIVRHAISEREIYLILLDIGLGPAMIISRVLRLLGSPKNIVFLKIDIKSLSNIGSVDLVTLLFTLHEITKTLYHIELLRAYGKQRMDRKILTKELPTLKQIVYKIHSILKEHGKLVVVDKMLDDFNATFVIELLNSLFKVKSINMHQNQFILEAIKH